MTKSVIFHYHYEALVPGLSALLYLLVVPLDQVVMVMVMRRMRTRRRREEKKKREVRKREECIIVWRFLKEAPRRLTHGYLHHLIPIGLGRDKGSDKGSDLNENKA